MLAGHGEDRRRRGLHPRLHSLTETLREKADAALWDDERKIYANRLWSGEFVDLCPTSFYPLLAGMPDAERVRALVGHIFNEDEFWTYVPLPAIWKQSPAFADNVYWRGRVWPPLNYMTYNGLKRYGLDKEASRLARAVHGDLLLPLERRACEL